MAQINERQMSYLLDSATMIREEISGLINGLQRIYDRLESMKGFGTNETIDACERAVSENQERIKDLVRIAEIMEGVYTDYNTPEMYGPPATGVSNSVFY